MDIFDLFDNELKIIKENVSRVESLVKYSQTLGSKEEHITSDLLRLAVVFLHATLEEVLRSLARDLLPYSDEKTLDKIPLAGMPSPAKFSLGKLASYRDKTVSRLIQDSVDAHLLKSTYNDTDDVADLLNSLGAEIKEDVRSLFPQIQALMERRHQIVHRADRRTRQEESERIDSEQVLKWVDAVSFFAGEVLSDPNLEQRARTARNT